MGATPSAILKRKLPQQPSTASKVSKRCAVLPCPGPFQLFCKLEKSRVLSRLMQELGAWPHGSTFVNANLVMAKEKAAMPQVAGEMRKQWSEMKQHNTNTRFIELATSMERISALV